MGPRLVLPLSVLVVLWGVLACTGGSDAPEPAPAPASAPAPAAAPAPAPEAAAPAPIPDWTAPVLHPAEALADTLKKCAALKPDGKWFGASSLRVCEGTWTLAGEHLSVDAACTSSLPTEDGSVASPTPIPFELDVLRTWSPADDPERLVIFGRSTGAAYASTGKDVPPGTFVSMGCESDGRPGPVGWVEVFDAGGGPDAVRKAGGLLAGRLEHGGGTIDVLSAPTDDTFDGVVMILHAPGFLPLAQDAKRLLGAGFPEIRGDGWPESTAPVRIYIGSSP